MHRGLWKARPRAPSDIEGDLADNRLLPRPQNGHALPSVLQSAFNVTRRGASGDIVERQDLSEPEAGVEAGVKA